MSDSADVYVCCGWCSDTELLEESYSLYGVKPPGRPPSGPPRSPFPPGAPPLPPGGQGYDATRYCTPRHAHSVACVFALRRGLPAQNKKEMKIEREREREREREMREKREGAGERIETIRESCHDRLWLI